MTILIKPRPAIALGSRIGVIAVPLMVFALCVLFVPRFLSVDNLQNVLRVGSILLIAACGQTGILIVGGIDFSMGSAVALLSVVTVILAPEQGVALAFAGGICVVVLVGLCNGLLIAYLKLPAFLVTLGMLMVLHGLASLLSGGMPLDAALSSGFLWLGSGYVAGIPVPIILALLAVLSLHGLLRYTLVGRSWYLVGTNFNAALNAGLPARRMVLLAYVVAGLFCALAGAILTSRVGSGQPNLYPDLAFATIAVCAIGGIPLNGGRGSAVQVVCGALIIAMLNNAVVLLNLTSAWQQLLMALVIAVAVVLPQLPNVRRRCIHLLTGNTQ
ncbi:ABC transporter permease [Pseudomonas sp. H3(2019)]|uniref:ABC transporter permease n=1 Tax=Pseudomonas sp. H3(2019) TaxID=2598724 RepID=UPI001190087E|nr:ABC transporter permease [Pseudomonas sp. H3(2019)]TVT84323.1 ABC transporter permease [Pseudomonas sp. H3(2019)]